MSIFLSALALVAAPNAQAPAAPANHAQHAAHQQEMQKHHDDCKKMMEKMHQGMKHDGHGAQQGDKAGGQQSHGSHQ